MKLLDWRKHLDGVKTVLKEVFKKYNIFLLHLSPQQTLAQWVVLYTIIGWVLLCLPFMNRADVSFIDNLFTAASAVSTTGLTAVNFADSYTWLGKLVTLTLIQLGGLGYMTVTAFLYMTVSRRQLKRRHKDILQAEFSLPQTVELQDFLRAAIIFTVIVESIGAVLLFNYFRHHDYGITQAAWYGVFHSISAFCTAGFSLWSDGLTQFADSKTINIILGGLSLAGAMGFIVVTDLFNWITRKTKEISYTTKVIAGITGAFVAAGTAGLWITTPGTTWAEAAFQTVSSMSTAGFNSVNIAQMSSCSLMILMILMSVGGSPSGTGGGIRTTTAAGLLALVSSRLRERKRVTFFGARIPLQRLYWATSTFLFYITLLFCSLFLLTWTDEGLPFIQLVFETASALSNAGLSSGASETLSGWGKIIIIVTMIIGRIGVITFGLALLSPAPDDDTSLCPPAEKEDLAV